MFEDQNKAILTDEEIARRIAQIDELISRQLNEILHHPEFKSLEANWRALHYLVNRGELGLNVKVKVFTAAQRELLKDFERAAIVEESAIFTKIFSDVYVESRQIPFNLLVGAYEFSRLPQDLLLLDYFADVAWRAHAPFISGVAPSMFGVESFDEVSGLQDISEAFQAPEFSRWNDLRVTHKSRFVGLCLPRILLRKPYETARTFNFRETDRKQDYLWGNAAFAFAGCIVRAQSEKNWLGKMRGVETDGEIEGLRLPEGESAGKARTQQSPLDARLENKFAELTRLGFMPLVNDLRANPYIFFSRSVHKPPMYDTDAANENALNHLKLENILAASRFAINLMSIWHDPIGVIHFKESLRSLKDKQIFLQRWLNRYTLPESDAPDEIKARHPVSECYLTLHEVPGTVGEARGILFIRPHYLLDEIKIAMRLEIHFARPYFVD
jgi:type VI secretion system protein ImpC